MNNMVKTFILSVFFVTAFTLSGEAQNSEFFENNFPPAGWSLINPNAGSITYTHYIGTNGPSYSGNRAIKMDFYSYSNSGHLDTLKTPIYRNISSADSLFFDWAYCQYPGYNDRLRVLMSTDGGLNFDISLFDKTGAALATVPASQSSFTPSSPSHWKTYAYPLGTADSVMLAFITTNNYGNNLYLDNIVVGTKPLNDISPIEFSNILPDTSYKTATFKPQILLGNFGSNTCANFNVTLRITPGGYVSTKTVNELSIGQNFYMEFDEYTTVPGNPITLTAYTSFTDDQNKSNDTLIQSSTFKSGYSKTVLFEQFTSSTCPPCAASNPGIDAFMDANEHDLLAVKYHVGWPAPGNDPMYLHNPTQSYDRRGYYSVNSVPTLIMEGTVRGIPPNSYLFNQSKLKGSPVKIDVRNVRIHQDSIKAIIIVKIAETLPAGNYYLRVFSIEKHIKYATAPGTNGEKDFYDVFRHAVPSTQGIPIPNNPGTYRYESNFYINPPEVDTMIYVGAFLQNDVNKTIVNSGKSGFSLSPDTVSARLTVGTLWSTVLPQYLDLLAASDEFLDTVSATFTLLDSLGDTLNVQNRIMEIINDSLFVTSYKVNSTGILGVNVSGRDFEGNWSHVNKNYNIGRMSKSKDQYVSGKDWKVDISRNMVEKDGYILIETIHKKTRYSHGKSYNDISGLIPVSDIMMINGSVSLKPKSLISVSIKPDLYYDGVSLHLSDINKISLYRLHDNEWILINSAYISGMIKSGVTEYGQYRLFYNPDKAATPKQFELSQNFPNPFNPITTIKFAVPSETTVEITVYNTLGQEVRKLVRERFNAGYFEISWDGKNNHGKTVGSGVYIYRMKTDGFVKSNKMIFLK